MLQYKCTIFSENPIASDKLFLQGFSVGSNSRYQWELVLKV
jgi:hypothetical protein